MRFSEIPEPTPRDLRKDKERVNRIQQRLPTGAVPYTRETDYLWVLKPSDIRNDVTFESDLIQAGAKVTINDFEVLVLLPRTLTYPTFLEIHLATIIKLVLVIFLLNLAILGIRIASFYY